MSLSKKLRKDLEELRDRTNPKNKKNILKKIKSLIILDNPSDRTITVRFSTAKKIFGETIKDLDFLKEIRPDSDLTKKVIQDNEEIRDTRRMKDINIDMFKKIINLKNSNNIYDNYLYALFISGRRTSELISATFKKGVGKNIYIMDGLLKTGSENAEDKICNFKTLSNKSFLILIRKIKKEIKQRKIKQFKKNLDNRIRFLFDGEITPHTLRSIYINYLYKFHNPENIEINPFIQQYLNHKTIKASLSYTGIKIDFDKPVANI